MELRGNRWNFYYALPCDSKSIIAFFAALVLESWRKTNNKSSSLNVNFSCLRANKNQFLIRNEIDIFLLFRHVFADLFLLFSIFLSAPFGVVKVRGIARVRTAILCHISREKKRGKSWRQTSEMKLQVSIGIFFRLFSFSGNWKTVFIKESSISQRVNYPLMKFKLCLTTQSGNSS